MTSTTHHREVGVVNDSKKEITSSLRNVMALPPDERRPDKSDTMRRRILRLVVLIEGIDASIYRLTER